MLKWRHAGIILSVLLNVFFIGVVVVVALDEKAERQRWDEVVRVLSEPNFVEYESEHLRFFRPRTGSELARIEPTAIYAAVDGVPRARFEFEDQELQAITSVSAYDEFGRRWVDVDFQDGKLSVEHYPNDVRSQPDLSFIDIDLDGIPDQKIDWALAKGFERAGEIVWRPMKTKDD
jgi:hypothetical protein